MVFEDSLSDFEYACNLAQSSFSFSQSDGVKIGVNGYSDKTDALLETIVDKFFMILKGDLEDSSYSVLMFESIDIFRIDILRLYLFQ